MDARPRCGSPHTEQEGDHAPHAVSETGCTNAPLAAHLRCNRHTPPPPSPPPRPSEVDSVFLDALVRYPLPLVSAAMACDVAGAEEELQLQLLYQPTRATMSSELRSPLAIAAPRHDGSVDERATAACAAAAVLSTALQHYWARPPCSSAAAPLSPPVVDRELATSAPRAAPSWAAVSPFRACATPAFQSALRGLPGRAVHPAVRGAPWTAMDRWCHGLPTAADGAPPRKRVRTTTAAAAASPASLASKAGGGDVAEASLAALVVDGGGGRGLRGESLPRAASPRHCGAAAVLHRRVAENDDVLGFLLGTAPAPATSCPAPLSDAAPLPPLPVTQSRQHGALVETCGPPAQAVGGLGAAGSAHGGAPPPVMLSPATDTGVQESVAAAAPHRSMAVPFADDGATLAELREQCVRLGLLSTGHKSILVQRLRLYCSAVQPEQRQQPQDAAPSPSPSAAGIGVSAPPISPLPERVAVHDGSADVVRTAGSPPRTVFRYRSQSPSLPSAPPAVAVVAAASEVDEPRRPRRRLVQSPMEFLHSRFPTKAPLSSAEVAGGAPPLPTTTRAQEEALKGEAARVRWRWLVDVRERAAAPRGGGGGGGRQHDAMLDIFHRQQVPIASVMLPAGDFMLSVELTPEEAAAAAAAAAHGDTEACGAATSADGDDGTSTSSSSVLSHLCSLVVERKTAADLDASVKGVRYSEQRRLLAASPFRLVVWLVEGTDVAQRGGHRRPPDGHLGRGGSPPPSRTPSPVPSCSSGGAAPPASPPPAVSSAECARQRVDTACASLGLHGAGFVVVRTRSTAESVQYLKALAVHVVRQLASRRLSRRCVVGSESGPLAGDAAGQRVCHGGAQETAAPLPPLRAGTRVPPCGDGTPCDATGDVSAAACVPCHSALHCFTPAAPCLDSVAALQRRLRARTAFPRMLMCVRGCSAALATLLSSRYGTLVGLWRELRRRGREVCDADPTIQRLTTAQTKVYVLLTEFLLATDYL